MELLFFDTVVHPIRDFGGTSGRYTSDRHQCYRDRRSDVGTTVARVLTEALSSPLLRASMDSKFPSVDEPSTPLSTLVRGSPVDRGNVPVFEQRKGFSRILARISRYVTTRERRVPCSWALVGQSNYGRGCEPDRDGRKRGSHQALLAR